MLRTWPGRVKMKIDNKFPFGKWGIKRLCGIPEEVLPTHPHSSIEWLHSRVCFLLYCSDMAFTHTHKQYLNEVLNIQEVDFAVVLVYVVVGIRLCAHIFPWMDMAMVGWLTSSSYALYRLMVFGISMEWYLSIIMANCVEYAMLWQATFANDDPLQRRAARQYPYHSFFITFSIHWDVLECNLRMRIIILNIERPKLSKSSPMHVYISALLNQLEEPASN